MAGWVGEDPFLSPININGHLVSTVCRGPGAEFQGQQPSRAGEGAGRGAQASTDRQLTYCLGRSDYY